MGSTLQSTLDYLEGLGGGAVCPPDLPAEQLKEYVKRISAVDGITIVTGSLIR